MRHKGSFSYSGRGMYGKECCAFRSLGDLIAACNTDPKLPPPEAWRTDALGRGTVYYHPQVAAPPFEEG